MEKVKFISKRKFLAMECFFSCFKCFLLGKPLDKIMVRMEVFYFNQILLFYINF